MKFLADMGISPRVVRTLRDNGHDAIHLQEQGLGRMSDADVLIKARNEERVLLPAQVVVLLEGDECPCHLLRRQHTCVECREE